MSAARLSDRRCGSAARRFVVLQIVDPVAVNANCSSMPGVSDPGRESIHREIRDNVRTAFGDRVGAKIIRKRRRLIAEIAMRRRRIALTLAPEEATDVAPVFTQQRVSVVFRMALKEE